MLKDQKEKNKLKKNLNDNKKWSIYSHTKSWNNMSLKKKQL